MTFVHRQLMKLASPALISLIVGCSGAAPSNQTDQRGIRTSVLAAQKQAEIESVQSIEVDEISLLAAKPGDMVVLSGKNFVQGMRVVIESASVELIVESPDKAYFIMPDVKRTGSVSLQLVAKSHVISTLQMVAEDPTDELPIMVVAPELVCSDIIYRNGKGEKKQGQRDCSQTKTSDQPANTQVLETLQNCTSTVSTDCRATTAFPAVDKSQIQTVAGSMKTNLTVAGVTGTLADCAENAAVGCVTTTAFKAADLTNLTAANIRSGVSVAGVAGAYPSAQNKLNGADEGTSDLTNATFNAQIKVDQVFEWFDASGARHTASGDADLSAANIASGVSVFGTVGTATLASGIDPWDLRVGTNVNGVTGKLKVSCRNGAKTAWDLSQPLAPTADVDTDRLTFNGHGYSDGHKVWFEGGTIPTGLAGYQAYYVVNSDSNSFQLSSTLGGSAIDITTTGSNFTLSRKDEGVVDFWDTVDDYYRTTSPWTSDNQCGGVEATAGDANIWKDVTSSTCDSAGDQCRFRDKITKLEWSEVQNGGAATDWGRGRHICDNLTFDGQSDWRSPTQKELMEAYSHGIYSAASANWITSTQMSTSSVWSGTHSSSTNTHAWNVSLTTGYQSNTWWTYVSALVVCVRGG